MRRSEFPNPLPTEYLGRVSSRQRDAVLLYIEQGLALREVGDLLGVTSQAVSNLLARAAAKLGPAKATPRKMFLLGDADLDRLDSDRVVAQI